MFPFFNLDSFLSLIFLTIKEIKGIEWIEFAIFSRKHHTGSFYRPQIEIMSIHEGDNQYAKYIFVGELF